LKKTVITLSTATALFFGSFAFSDSVKANTIDDLKEKQSELKDERKEVKKDLSKAEEEIADILIDLESLNKEITELEESLKANEKAMKETESDIAEKEEEIEKLEEEIAELEDSIDKRLEILQERARSYQQSGGSVNYLEVIFGAKDFLDLIGRVAAVNKITDSDVQLMEALEEDKEKVEIQKEKVNEKLADLNNLKNELEKIKEFILEQKSESEQKREELKKKEKELRETKNKLELKDKELADLEQKVKNRMNNILNPPAPKQNKLQTVSQETSNYSGGKFSWPTVGGYISSEMGQRWGRLHGGIDIARTDRSTSPPILAAEGGVVVSAGFDGGFGNKVVIDHGDGLKTVYAHLASISVSSGQSVSRGTQLGIMGTTGSSTGIHLHFEVHQNGQRQNPRNYLN